MEESHGPRKSFARTAMQGRLCHKTWGASMWYVQYCVGVAGTNAGEEGQLWSEENNGRDDEGRPGDGK
jgi:hypothetical protein